MTPAAEMPWWVTGLLAPAIIALFTAMIGGACYLGRTLIAAATADRQAYQAYLRQEADRGREERARFVSIIDAFREDLREHTTISKQMYHTLEQMERRMGRE